jgi:eukaryotic-like serine/threonine-protein kinase
VFLAEDQRLGRQVAVKRLHAHSPEDIARRFQREARLGAALNHPNLVAVYDVETDGESVLIVMEYVEGTTLAAELKAGALGVDRTVAMISDVAAALDAVHDKGIVHRDVKPANVLIRGDGTAKLADLGIASLAEGTSITASGAVLGTAAYMAPEQVRGETVGPQADIYALAALAYEALGGERAHQGDTPVQIAHSITDDPAPDVRDSWPGAPAGLASVLMRGMALRPEDRPRRAGELAAELRAAAVGVADPPTEALAPTAATRTAPAQPPPAPAAAPATTHRSRRSPLVPVVALAAVVAAAVLAFVLLSGGDDGGGGSTAPETTASRPQATETSEAPATAPAPQPTTPETTQEPTPQPTTPSAGGTDPASASRLNDRGYALLKGGDAAAAVPVLQQAVAAFPDDSTDLNHAYALFNLAQALRQTGRAEEAIPLLEKRLSFSDNQRKTVEKELAKARKDAGR